MSEEVKKCETRLLSYADLPLSAFDPLKGQAEVGAKSLQRATSFIKQYLDINKAYSQSLKRLASASAIEETEDNPMVKESLACFRGFLLNESRQSEEFVKALNLEAIVPLKHVKEKNQQQVKQAVMEVKKIVKNLNKKSKDHSHAAQQASKANAHVQKEQQALKPAAGGSGNDDHCAVKMSFDDFFASGMNGRVSSNGGQAGSQESVGDEQVGKIESSAQQSTENRRGNETGDQENKESVGGGDEKHVVLPSKFSAWLANSASKINSHLKPGLSETIDNKIKRGNELLEKAANMKQEYDEAKALSDVAVSNFWVIFEASEKRRITALGDSLRRICVSGCSKFAS